VGNPSRGPRRKAGTGTTVTHDLPWPPRRVSGCQTHPWAPSPLTPGPSPNRPALSLSGHQGGSWIHPRKTQPREQAGDPSPSDPGEQHSSAAGDGRRQGPGRQGCLLQPWPFAIYAGISVTHDFIALVPEGTDRLSLCLAPTASPSSPASAPKPVGFHRTTGSGDGSSPGDHPQLSSHPTASPSSPASAPKPVSFHHTTGSGDGSSPGDHPQLSSHPTASPSSPASAPKPVSFHRITGSGDGSSPGDHPQASTETSEFPPYNWEWGWVLSRRSPAGVQPPYSITLQPCFAPKPVSFHHITGSRDGSSPEDHPQSSSHPTASPSSPSSAPKPVSFHLITGSRDGFSPGDHPQSSPKPVSFHHTSGSGDGSSPGDHPQASTETSEFPPYNWERGWVLSRRSPAGVQPPRRAPGLISPSPLSTPNRPRRAPIHHSSPVPSRHGEQVFASTPQILDRYQGLAWSWGAGRTSTWLGAELQPAPSLYRGV